MKLNKKQKKIGLIGIGVIALTGLAIFLYHINKNKVQSDDYTGDINKSKLKFGKQNMQTLKDLRKYLKQAGHL